MSYIPHVFNQNTITFQVNHKLYMIDDSFPGFEAVKAELKSASPNVDRLISLTKPAEAVKAQVAAAVAADRLPAGKVSVTNSEIRYNDVAIHGVLVDRILDHLAEGFDIMPMVRFLENLYRNPADFAREELYLWLETSNLPITEDGHFLAYKNVNANFTSIHDGVTDNSPGTVVSMARENVDPVRDRTCSRGLHFCSKQYLPNFYTSGAKTLVLKINPADVVSIPSDYSNTKGRAWQYLVLDVVDEDPQSKQWSSIVSADGGTFTQPTGYGVEPQDENSLINIGSDLAKSLFAACNEVGLTDRDARLDWAYDTLENVDMEGDFSDSFNELTVGQATYLLERLHEQAADLVAAADETIADAENLVADAVAEARQMKIDMINGLGIIALRSRASAAGLTGAWNGPKSKDLKAYLISQIK